MARSFSGAEVSSCAGLHYCEKVWWIIKRLQGAIHIFTKRPDLAVKSICRELAKKDDVGFGCEYVPESTVIQYPHAVSYFCHLELFYVDCKYKGWIRQSTLYFEIIRFVRPSIDNATPEERRYESTIFLLLHFLNVVVLIIAMYFWQSSRLGKSRNTSATKSIKGEMSCQYV